MDLLYNINNNNNNKVITIKNKFVYRLSQASQA